MQDARAPYRICTKGAGGMPFIFIFYFIFIFIIYYVNKNAAGEIGIRE
jgi:hypothetical protein